MGTGDVSEGPGLCRSQGEEPGLVKTPPLLKRQETGRRAVGASPLWSWKGARKQVVQEM